MSGGHDDAVAVQMIRDVIAGLTSRSKRWAMTMIDFGALRWSRARIAAENAEHQRRAAERALWWARAALASDRAATSRRAARRLRDIYDRECLLPEIRQLANVMQRRADRLAARSMIYPQPRRVYPGLEEARS